MFNIPEDHFDSPFPTTTDEWMRDQASDIGFKNQVQAWILTSWDIWVANPYYKGPEVPHPEDYSYEDDDGEELSIAASDKEEMDEFLEKMDKEIPF